MPALVAGFHLFRTETKAWMAAALASVASGQRGNFQITRAGHSP
jgi:hypothetical protein